MFLLASVVTIVRHGFLVGIVKFPSFMFKNNSNIRIEAYLKIQYVFRYEIEVVLLLLLSQPYISELIVFFLVHKYREHRLEAG